MIKALCSVLILVSISLLGPSSGTEGQISQRHNSRLTGKQAGTLITQGNDSDEVIKGLIASLHDSGPSKNSDAAKTQILVIARTSTPSRARVIRLLVDDASNQSELDGRHVVLGEIFDYWLRTTQILAELRALESIDLLIKCIYAGNGLTGSLAHRPAFNALVQIGAPAVRKLGTALLTGNDEYAKMNIALCLGSVGGRDAERALNEAIRIESNKDVIRYLSRALAMIKGDQSATDLNFP